MPRHSTQAPNPNPDARLEGLVMRTFVAKTLACVVLTSMSLYVILQYWSEMDTSTNMVFKSLGCCVSFLLLAPSVYDAGVMSYLLMSLYESDVGGRTHDDYLSSLHEEYSLRAYLAIIAALVFCFPCTIGMSIYLDGCAFPLAGAVVGFVDLVQTLILFPLTVVVIFTSGSGIEIFVNLVAVQVFGNLDDIFAYAVTNRRSEIWKHTSKLYLNWQGGEPKKPDHTDV